METNAPPPGNILKHICIFDYREFMASAMVAILDFKLPNPYQNVLCIHVVRTQQAAKRVANPHQDPTCPEGGGDPF